MEPTEKNSKFLPLKKPHRRNNSNFPVAPPCEDLEGQIDRLNHALHEVMQEIDLNSYTSRISSRLSFAPSEVYYEADPENLSFKSEDINFPSEFEARVEELLQTIDRDEMIIEDFRAEELRKLEFQKNKIFDTQCTHDIPLIRCEIELQLKMQKNLQLEKAKKDFDEKLYQLDMLKEDYEGKRKEILGGIQKLSEKEALLEEKEKELRASRMAFDRHRYLWEQEHGSGDFRENLEKSQGKPVANSLRNSLPLGITMKTMLSHSQKASEGREKGLDEYQTELKKLEKEMELEKLQGSSEFSEKLLKIDQIRNRISAIRGEKVMSDSANTTRLMSNIMLSIQKHSEKEDQSTKRSQLLERMKKKTIPLASTPKNLQNEIFRLKQLDQKAPETSETTRRFLFSDAPTPKGINTPRTVEKEEHYRVYYENKKKMFAEKEKELKHKELMLQETWMKLPGAKELIENVNLTIARMGVEKKNIEKQKEEMEKERLEFGKMKEKVLAQLKCDEKIALKSR